MTAHLGCEKQAPDSHHMGSSRNGTSGKRLTGETRWQGFGDKILSLCGRGMTTREIQGHLKEMPGLERRKLRVHHQKACVSKLS
jgi:putative transposase